MSYSLMTITWKNKKFHFCFLYFFLHKGVGFRLFIFLWPLYLFLCGSDSLLEQCVEIVYFLKKKDLGHRWHPYFLPTPTKKSDFFLRIRSSLMISILFRNLLVKKEWLSICCYNRIYRFCYGPTFIVWIFVTPTLENIFQVSLEWKTRENISFLAFLEFLPYSAVLYFCLLNFCVRLLLMQRLTSSEYSTRVITDDSQSHFSSIFFLFLSLSQRSRHAIWSRIDAYLLVLSYY